MRDLGFPAEEYNKKWQQWERLALLERKWITLCYLVLQAHSTSQEKHEFFHVHLILWAEKEWTNGLDGVTLKKPCLISNPSPRKILDIKWDDRVCQLTGSIHQAPTYSSFFPWVPQDLLWHQVMEQSSALDKSLEQCWIYSIIHTIQIFIVHFKKHNNI